MILGTTVIVEWLASVIGMSANLVQQLLWGALLAGLLFATALLITMLVTRWGDRDPTSKSLLFSLLVHVSCAFGVVAVTPLQPRLLVPKEDERVRIRELFVDGEETIQLDRSGNSPVWEDLPETSRERLSRLERASAAFASAESFDRGPQPVPIPDVELPDVASVPAPTAAAPQLQRNAETGVRESAAPMRTDEETAEARTGVKVPAVVPVRRPLERSGLRRLSVEREPAKGSVDRVEERFSPSRYLAEIEAPDDPDSFLTRDDEGDIVKRQTGPVPPTSQLPEPGALADEQKRKDAASSSAKPSRFTRLQPRTPRRNGRGAVERTPTPPSKVPAAAPETSLAARDGTEMDLPGTGVQPKVVRPDVQPLLRPQPGPQSLPATYRLRNFERRREAARKYGGTDESERAVEQSLQWLASIQSGDGHFDAQEYAAGQVDVDENGIDRKSAGIRADTGLTGLAVLAFLGAGYTHEEGRYADNVQRALLWLIQEQADDGSLGGNATRYARMYCHAMATFALAEAYGMQDDRSANAWLREPLQRAIQYIVDMQHSGGGWRYVKGQPGDMSMFGWQLMALKSAEIAGVPVADGTKRRMVNFLLDRSLGDDKGLAAYRVTDPPLPPTPSMTAEALFCKQMLGMKRSNPASREAVDYLLDHPPKRSEQNLYYWYYGTLAMYQYGGEDWRQWNEALRDLLVEDQLKSGEFAGSWQPRPPWGPYGGRIYSTALSTLCLEVYYRFLPLYQYGGQYAER